MLPSKIELLMDRSEEHPEAVVDLLYALRAQPLRAKQARALLERLNKLSYALLRPSLPLQSEPPSRIRLVFLRLTKAVSWLRARVLPGFAIAFAGLVALANVVDPTHSPVASGVSIAIIFLCLLYAGLMSATIANADEAAANGGEEPQKRARIQAHQRVQVLQEVFHEALEDSVSKIRVAADEDEDPTLPPISMDLIKRLT